MKAKLVIFDLDGTLLDSIDDLAASTNHALQLHGYPQHERAAYRYFVGNGVRKLIERALPEDARQADNINRLLQDFLAYYQTHKTVYTHPYQGIPETLAQLHAAGIQLAVASNKYHQGTLELIRHYFGEKLFSVVLGQREDIPVKPDPTIVHDILTQTALMSETPVWTCKQQSTADSLPSASLGASVPARNLKQTLPTTSSIARQNFSLLPG